MNAHSRVEERSPQEQPLDVIIVGAGISGIGMAAHLVRDCPGKSFLMLDRRTRPGGTWDLFRYPGIRSDSDMYTLGFAFEPWREDRTIAEGGRILAYLDKVVADHDLGSRMRFSQKVISADWDSKAALWRLKTEDSEFTCRFLFLGSGYYDHDNPHDAALPGLESFGGTVIHPQFWPEGFDHAGRRIVVVGSGATAVTLVPNLADRAAHVTMLQRTPTWFIQRPAKDGFANLLRRLLPDRWAYALVRWRNTFMQDWLFRRCRANPEGMGEFLGGQVRDALGPAWSEKDFTPPYGPWEQRLCLVPDGDLFAAIRSGRASVATGEIDHVEKDGVRLKDGRLIEADTIVTATGLRLAIAGKIAISLDGEAVNFAERWYYRNAMFSGLPNFAALFGYLNAGWTLRVDIVAEWLTRLFNQMDAWGVDVVTPVLPDGPLPEEHNIFDDFSSGYLQRGRNLMPRSARSGPWRISMDYLADRRELREAPIDDGNLHFARSQVAQAATVT
jgi:monooxygenase